MASLKRDTPAGRAAMARRRQRAAAVVEHSARFVDSNAEEDQDPSLHPSPIPMGYAGSAQQQQQQQQEHSNVHFHTPDKLLERSAQVAQAAASVLASVRTSRQPQTKSYAAESTHEATGNDLFQDQVSGQNSAYHEGSHQSSSSLVDFSMRPHHPSEISRASPVTSSRSVGFHDQHHQQRVEGLESQEPEDYHNDTWQQQQQQQQSTYPVPGHTTILQEDTAEEMEPVSKSNEPESIVDSASIMLSGSLIVLKSVATSTTLTTEPTPYGESPAQIGGAGLSTPDEVFEIVKLNSSYLPVSDPNQRIIRWGDNVSLVSLNLVDQANNDKPRALGINRRHKGNSADMQLGWFRSTRGPAETWTVLRGPGQNKQAVRIGMPSLRPATILAHKRLARGVVTRPICSGDPILLRNNETGGLLSVNLANGALEVVTDGYRGSSIHNTAMDSLGQLQRNNLYFATDQDTFVLLESSVPPCPRWVLSSGTSSSCNTTFNPLGHRMYLHQTYTTEPNRNKTGLAIQEALFGYNCPTSTGATRLDGNLEAMGLADQESVLLDEVLGACLGLEGKFIRTRKMEVDQTGKMNSPTTVQGLKFDFVDGAEMFLDNGLRNLAHGVLPLATSFTHVSEFLASHFPGYEYGSVMQAFCEAIEAILKEYTDLIGAMERHFRQPRPGERRLTLQRLHATLMPSLDIMALLKRVTMAIRGKAGGALINRLAAIKSESCEGDLIANKVLTFLLDRSSIPYMTMLTTWLQCGLLRDPYSEFMIEVRHQGSATSKQVVEPGVSEESYVMREENVLTELMSSDILLQKVVATGKYRRAARGCQLLLRRTVGRGDGETLERGKLPVVLRYSLDFSSLSCFIQSMYESASRGLVNVLLKDFNLLDALRSMKEFFLLGHGDFLGNFLDSAEDELVKDLGDISSGRIQHWLRMSVQLTNAGSPTKKQNPSGSVTRFSPLALRCRFVPISLIEHVDSIQFSGNGNNARSNKEDSVLGTPLRDAYGISNKGLTGVETLTLEYASVPFPISLVLKESALDSYQLLFRLLFFAKYAERRLLGIWQDHQAVKELSSVRGLFGATFLLRQRMLHFAQNLIYYFVFEVIEPNWLQMEEAIGNPSEASKRTVDDLVDVHNAFLCRTLEACLLTNRELVRTLTKLMTTCLMFADQMKLFTEATRIYDESSHIAAERREAIQRSLNDRGAGVPKAKVDKLALREAIQSFRQDRQLRLKKQKRRVGRELGSDSYRRMVSRFDEVFSAYLSEFMAQLNGDVGTSNYAHKTNLCSRLDYNGFLLSSIQTFVN